MSCGLVLYGAPASGKDTVTAALAAHDSRFQLFKRLKTGPGRNSGYHMVTNSELDQKAAQGELIWENTQYGARYAIDRSTLKRMFSAGVVPVVHAGQHGVVRAVRQAAPGARWVVVQLRCSRESARVRIIGRDTGDADQRLAVWDRTPPLADADLTIDTDAVSANTAAELILQLTKS